MTTFTIDRAFEVAKQLMSDPGLDGIDAVKVRANAATSSFFVDLYVDNEFKDTIRDEDGLRFFYAELILDY